MSRVITNPFLEEVLNDMNGDQVLQCYQCGTCTGSCPMIEQMQYGPRKILSMIQLGMEEEVLKSPDIWFCVSCYSCTNRCPREIPITRLMGTLRKMAIARGWAKHHEVNFGNAFATTIKNHGRIYESAMMARYFITAMDIKGLIALAPIGIKMFLKGKIPLLPDNIKKPKSMQPLCEIQEKE